MRKALFFTLASFALLILSVFPQKKIPATYISASRSDQSFIENKGQWNPDVLFLTKVNGMNAWITKTGVVFDFYKTENNFRQEPTSIMNRFDLERFESQNTVIKGNAVFLKFLNANPLSATTGRNLKEGYFNYFTGNDESKWKGFVPLWSEVIQKDIVDGVDIRYYYDGSLVRFDYLIKPGTDISKLSFSVNGADGISVNNDGEIVMQTSSGIVTFGEIYSYQNISGSRSEVSCRYVTGEDGIVSLVVSGYDKTRELIIDPLIYSTYLGGSNVETYGDFFVDTDETVYILASTLSADYPVTPGVYQTTKDTATDIVISKFNPALNGLVFSTFFGGAKSDIPAGFVIAPDKSIYFTGQTYSTDFPITSTVYQNTLKGTSDAFISKITGTGTTLVYSSFFGGVYDDNANKIILNSDQTFYLAGRTTSSNFPVTPGAFQSALGGGNDAFITRFAANGLSLLYSTYIGGSQSDQIIDMALGPLNSIFAAGTTMSSNFPVTPQTLQQTLKGATDLFLLQLNNTGTTLLQSTFLGGSNYDNAEDLFLAPDNSLYLTGSTASPDFPVSSWCYQTSFLGNTDAFLVKISPSVPFNRFFSTFLGGSEMDVGYSVFADSAGAVYVAGLSHSSDFPIMAVESYSLKGSGGDAFLSILNQTGGSLLFSDLIGGNLTDFSKGVIRKGENIFLAGETLSGDFPVTSGAFQTSSTSGNYNLFALKMKPVTLKIWTPHDGAVYFPGETVSIGWNSLNMGEIKVDFSTDGGSSWINIGTNIPPQQTSLPWTVPSFISNNCKLRVVSLQDPTLFDVTDSTFTIDVITLVAPVAGQVLSSGITQNIAWACYMPGKIKIDISSNNGNDWIVLRDSVSMFYSGYSFVMPPFESPDCLVRLTSVENPGVQVISGKFRVTSLPVKQIKVNVPNNSELLRAKTNREITWTISNGNIDFVKIEYSTDAGRNWKLIYDYYPSGGSTQPYSVTYNWFVPATISSQCKIRISDNSDPSGQDLSDSCFTIVAEPLTNVQNTTVGQNNLTFGNSLLELNMFVVVAQPVTVTYDFVNPPVAGTLPTGVVNAAKYFWRVSAPGLSFTNGEVKVDYTQSGGVSDPSKLVWLRRSNPGDPWINIGAQLEGNKIGSNVYFSSLGEFTLGSTDNSNPLPVKEPKNLPEEFALLQNYPNPFNPSTVISYQLPAQSRVSLKLFDVLGREIAVLVDEVKEAGYHSFYISTNNFRLTSGVYYYQLQTGNFLQTKAMVLVK